jgi:hypothetical protein
MKTKRLPAFNVSRLDAAIAANLRELGYGG